MEWLDNNTEDTFGIEIGDFIVNRSILLADITEAKYVVKTKKTDDDVDAVVNLTIGNGLTKLAGDTEADAKLVVQFSSSDYGPTALNTDSRFYAGLAIKTATMTDWLEIVLEDDDLVILDSFFV